MNVFVTGGTGLIGRHLAVELQTRGDRIVVLTRNATAARRLLPDPVLLVEGNPTVPGAWQEAVAEADAVVNLAGEPIFGRRWTVKQKEKLRASRIQSTENVAKAMVDHGPRPKTLVSGSAVGYYGPRGAEKLSEGALPGTDFLAQVGVVWEGATRIVAEAGIRVVLLRTGIVLAREGGALEQMLLPFRLHLGGTIGSGRQWVSWIHIDDLVRAIIFALDNEGLEGPVNATAPTPVTNRQFAETLGATIGRKSWLPVPRILLRAAMGEVADVAARGQRAIPSKLLAAGYRFRYAELSDALDEILAR